MSATEGQGVNPPLIEQVRVGMEVHDSAGEHIGKLTYYRIGDPSAIDIEPMTDRPVGEQFAVAMGGHREPNVPPPLLKRFLMTGYLKVDDKRRLKRDHHYYALADQIASVEDDAIRLTIAINELITPYE
jgi:hypothetical protein